MLTSLVLKPLLTLALERPTVEGLPRHLAAGSGLTEFGDRIHVVADDALDLAVFERNSDRPGRLFPLFQRPALPADHKERKKLKPDLESAFLLQHQGKNYWLALGSGSSENRNSGVCVELDALGEPVRSVEFDLTPLYQNLKTSYADLNIEGAAPVLERGRLRLAQRGNSGSNENALLDLDLSRAFEAARTGQSWGPDLLLSRHSLSLPSLPGAQRPVPLTITDLAPLDGQRCIFTAAAEDTDNPYEDGAVLGSAIGILDSQGRVSELHQVDRKVKLEGISAQTSQAGIRALVVTDADDPEVQAMIYETWLTAR